jgi:hypothetical protein
MEPVIIFYGSWSLIIVSAIHQAGAWVRVRIAGSTDADGVIDGVAGQGLAKIDGPTWGLFVDFSRDAGTTWIGNTLHRRPGVTAGDGLIIDVAADVNNNGVIFADCRLVYLNRTVNPVGSGEPPFGFTVPGLWPQRPPAGKGFGGCNCGCCKCSPGRISRCRCH